MVMHAATGLRRGEQLTDSTNKGLDSPTKGDTGVTVLRVYHTRASSLRPRITGRKSPPSTGASLSLGRPGSPRSPDKALELLLLLLWDLWAFPHPTNTFHDDLGGHFFFSN